MITPDPTPSEVSADTVDRLAARLIRIRVYGGDLPGHDERVRGQWTRLYTAEERDFWRREARALLDDLGLVAPATDPAPAAEGRQITVCGAVAEQDDTLVCILPPGHAQHTQHGQMVWHKAVNDRGAGMEFGIPLPGYVPPKLTDLAGLFGPEDTNHLCSVHWARFLRYTDTPAEWWDESCEHCDHEKARPMFPELATPAAPQATAEPSEPCNGSGAVADWDAPASEWNMRGPMDTTGEPPGKPCGGCANCRPLAGPSGLAAREAGTAHPPCAWCQQEPAGDPQHTVNGDRLCGECWADADAHGFDEEEA